MKVFVKKKNMYIALKFQCESKNKLCKKKMLSTKLKLDLKLLKNGRYISV